MTNPTNTDTPFKFKPLSYKDLLENNQSKEDIEKTTVEETDTITVNPPSKSGPLPELPIIKTELINPLIPEKIAQIQDQITDFNKKDTITKSKFNFATNWVKFVLGAIVLSILVLLTFAYFNVAIPNIDQDALKLSNQDAIITSKNSPFFVNVNGKNKLSYESKGINIVELGKLEGENNINIGSVLSWGPININSGNTKTFKLKRDYTGIFLKNNINKFYEDTNPIIDLELNKEETNFEVSINNVNSTENEKCKADSATLIKCSFEFAGQIKRPLIISIKDNAGNISEVFNDTVELVPVSKFECNKSIIELDGKIECISNFDGKVKYNNTDYNLTKNNKLFIDQILDDGPQKLNFVTTTSQGIIKSYSQEYQVNKQLLSVMFNSTVDEKYGTPTRPLILLTAISSTDASLDFNESYVENTATGFRKPFKLLNVNSIKKSEKLTIIADQYDEDLKNNLNLKLKFRNTSGRIANYSCTREFNQKEFKCISY
jgi:hypothetical protein